MNKVSGKIQAKSWQPTPLPHVQKRGNAVRPFPTQVTQEAESQTIQGKESRGNHRVIAPAPAVGMLANVNRAIATVRTTEPAGTGMTVQAKLTIGAPGDKYEQEADRVAQQVVQRLQAPATPPVAPPSGDGSEPTVQRQVAIPIMQRVTAGLGGSTRPMPADAGFEAQLQRSRSGGSPLDAAFRAKVEPLMGADFSGVRVHTDGKSDRLARSIQAKAFTTGQDMYFSSGAYEPGSRGGQELLAHELTHVVQQKANPAPYEREDGKVKHTKISVHIPLRTNNNADERVQAVFGNYAYDFAFASHSEVDENYLRQKYGPNPTNANRLRENLKQAFLDHNMFNRNDGDHRVNISVLNKDSENYIANQAHHIVEANDPAAYEARQILNWAGIHIDSAINGVILPSIQHDDSEAETVHNGSHNTIYSLTVVETLMRTLTHYGMRNNYFLGIPCDNVGYGVVKGTLSSIRRLLIEQPVPLNRRVDHEFYDPAVHGAQMTVESIMRHLFRTHINDDASYNPPANARQRGKLQKEKQNKRRKPPLLSHSKSTSHERHTRKGARS